MFGENARESRSGRVADHLEIHGAAGNKERLRVGSDGYRLGKRENFCSGHGYRESKDKTVHLHLKIELKSQLRFSSACAGYALQQVFDGFAQHIFAGRHGKRNLGQESLFQ